MSEVTIYKTWDEPLADMAVGLLCGDGIHAGKHDSGLRSSIAVTVDGLGEIEIRVPEDEVEEAIAILKVRFGEDFFEDQ